MSEYKKLSREEIAKLEIGHTDIGRARKLFLSLFFLLLIGIYPVAQFVYELREKPFTEVQALQIFPLLADSGPDGMVAAIKRYENTLEDTSLLRKLFLVPAQRIMLKAFGVGNEKVVLGSDGWLFYTSDFNYLVNPGFLRPERLYKRGTAPGIQPDPVTAILDFDRQLKQRGIKLIVFPAPVKPMLYADKLGGGGVLLQNHSYPEFKKRLEEAGVMLFDPTPELAAMRRSGVEPYLKTDTHWTPDGMELAARGLARRIDGDSVKSRCDAAVDITASGDIAAMLKLEAPEKYFPMETVKIRPVTGFRPNASSDVLLLGDSFTNIYSVPAMKWGEKAGLGERLSAYLGRGIDVIARNDAGAFATRELLAHELRRGRDKLAGKKFLIYEFAVRELADGNWKLLDLTPGKAPESKFLVLTEKRLVSGTVAAISAFPRPHSAPYKDHLLSLHLVDIDGGTGQAVVYTPSMIDNRLTVAAALRCGDKIRVQLSPWSAVEGEYGGWNRSEPDNEELLLQEPLWGESIQPEMGENSR